MSTNWVPPAEVLATLPCPWSELSDAERSFVEAVMVPGGLGEVLAAVGQAAEGVVSLIEGA
ncbi:hypothetical protein ACWEDZ_01970 [Streptomyces sp. NPDC005047]